MTEKHPLNLTPGQEGTLIVRCPDCGQLEVWTTDECTDHGLCRSRGGPCWCEGEAVPAEAAQEKES